MGKKKRSKQKAVRQRAYLPSTDRVIVFGESSRENTTQPFCAYFGPNGETCSETFGLAVVLSLPSIPPVMVLACPLHYGIVSVQAEAFRRSLLANEVE